LAPRGDGLVEVHAAFTDVGGDEDGVGEGLFRVRFVAITAGYIPKIPILELTHKKREAGRIRLPCEAERTSELR
jgi:hypothetical protein